ncbi:MAG: NTP transferase domain-containing protein, partial [Pseudomonadota bacterium]|nr:NTP transferase domain-containing protein [Pseudomonadota bacterium]
MTGAVFPSRAMVLAAGRGQRMRPLTDACPKPLLPVAGRTILDHSLDKLAAFGIEAVVVNCSYLGAQIVDHLAGRTGPPVILSPEDSPLETGGGVRNALDHLGDAPFFVINGDSLW